MAASKPRRSRETRRAKRRRPRAPVEPILVDTEQAQEALGRIGRTKLFELLAEGKIPSVTIGRRRLIPIAGLNAYVARLMAEANEHVRPARPDPVRVTFDARRQGGALN